MITIKLTLDTRSQKNDGTFPIKLYASYKKDFVRIGTGYNAKQEHWSNTEYFNRKEPNFQIKNMKLRNMLSEIEKQVFLIEQPNIQKINPNRSLETELALFLMTTIRKMWLYIVGS